MTFIQKIEKRKILSTLLISIGILSIVLIGIGVYSYSYLHSTLNGQSTISASYDATSKSTTNTASAN